MVTTPTQNQSNGGTNMMYQDLPQVIKTMKNEPDDDFTKTNLSQWDKDPLTDGNGCTVIMYNVVVKTGMIFHKAEYSGGRGKWSNKHKLNGKADDDISFLEWETREKIPQWKTREKIRQDGNANRACKTNVQTNFKTDKLQGETKWVGTKYKQVFKYY